MDYRAKVNEVIASTGLQLGQQGVLPEIDSLEVMSLVTQLEEAVGMMIPGDEMVPENFRTVDDIVALLSRMARSAEAGATSRP
jgi:acyl carrier protein